MLVSRKADMAPRLQHGGGLDAAARRFGIPKAGWLDLSTGINPVPYPLPEVSVDHWARLPDETAEQDLLEAARAFYGVPDGARIVAAPGTQALIQLLPLLLAPSKVSVLGPTYGEHLECWRGAGHQASSHPMNADWPEDADVVVLVNPNNPDGHRWAPAEIIAGLRPGRLVIVDEAFADVVPAISTVAHTAPGGLLVLRSFGKFFGLAGLRLGFAITDAPLADQLGQALGPWAVAGPALEIGARALRDAAWIDETRAGLAAHAARLDVIMAAHVDGHLGGTDLFRLYDVGARDLHGILAAQGIWTRAFDDRPGLLRLGLPGDEKDFRRLAAALA